MNVCTAVACGLILATGASAFFGNPGWTVLSGIALGFALAGFYAEYDRAMDPLA